MKKTLQLLTLVALLAVPWVATAQNTLTVADGTETNSYVPIYGWYADAYLRCQIIYPASDIVTATTTVGMNGGSITALTFYTTQSSVSGLDGTFEVKIMETTASTLSSFQDMSTATSVFTGTVGINNSQMTITFTTPYTYNGGNLLLEVTETSVSSSYPSTTFYGISQSGASVQGNSYSGVSDISPTQRNFIPKTTFTFTGGAAVTCPPVQARTVSDVDSNSATITWVDTMNSGATYTVNYWAATGDTTVVSGITGSSYIITGINANTVYNYTVTVNCSATDESVAMGGSFRTACSGITLPLVVDFEDAAYNGAWYPCWDSTIHAGTDPSVNDQNSPANHTTGGTYAMYLQSNSSENYNLVVSPAIPLPGDQIYVSFWARCSSNAWMKAGVITNPRDTSTFIPLVDITGNSWNEYTFTTASLDPTATYYIAWLGYRNSGFIGKFDDILVRQDNGCNKPTLAVVDSVGPYTAYLSWTTGGNSTTGYDLFYNTTNDINTATVENVSDMSDTVHYTITGLLPQTQYYAWVRTACGSDSAEAKYIGSFTTDMTCAPVINTTIGNIGYTAAQINWTYDSTVGFPTEGVQITIVDNTDTNVTPEVVDVTGTTYTFSDLLPGHSYTAILRNMCQTDIQTDTAAAVTVNFMTTSCAEIATDGNTNQYIPTYTYYNYSLSEMIYTAAQMPNIDTIHGIAFLLNSSSNTTRNIDVYIGHTTASTFSSGSAWISADSLTLVDSAFSLNCTQTGWVAIPFSSDFIYNGTDNLVIAIDDNTGSYVSAPTWGAVAANSQGINVFNDYTNFDPNTTSYSGTVYNTIPAIRFMASCEVPQCFAPMLSVEGVDSNNINISWVATGAESEWVVGIRTGNGAINWNSSSVTDTFFYFAGLTANTLYNIYVGSLCDGDTIMATLNVKTSCGAMSLPYSTSFEGDATGQTPSCWTVIDGHSYSSYYGDTYPSVSTGAHTGNRSLGFATSGTSLLIASSALPANNEALMVSFWAKTDAYYGLASLTLQAGIMTNLANDTTFTPMISLTGDNSYGNYDFATPVLSSDTTYYLAFRYTCDYEYATADVDDIEIRTDDGCHRSTNVVALGVDTNEIAVSWSNDGLVDNFVVEYRLQGTNTWSAPVNPYDTVYTISGLATATAYEIIVGTVCTSDTLWTTPVVAKTTCAPMVLPYSTSFENDNVGEIPACWNNSGATGTDYYGTTYPCVDNSYNTEAHTGTNALTFTYIIGSSIVSSEAVTTDGDSIHVSFWAKLESSTYYGTPILEAGVMTNPAIDTTFISLVNVTATDYTHYEFNTATLNHNTTYYVAFRYSATSEYISAFVDDINISHDEGCMYPSNLSATPGINIMDLSWHNASSTDNFVIQYRPAGNTAWDTTIATTDTAYFVTGLNHSTNYEIRVGFLCGTDTMWTTVYATTLCGLEDVPYFENFYSADGTLPPCWDYQSPVGWNNWPLTSGNGELMFGAYSAGQPAVLPQFDAPFTKLQITFYTKCRADSEGDGILIGVADAAGTLLQWIDTLYHPNHSQAAWVEHTYNFLNYYGPGERIALGRKLNAAGNLWASIDSITVIALADCYPVDSLKAHNLIDPDHTTFTWQPQGQESSWQVYVDTVTANIDSIPDSLFVSVNDTAYTIPMGAIQGGGIYRFYVRADCDIEQSDWVSYEFGAGTVIMNNSATADTVVGCGLVVYDNGGPVAGYLDYSNSALVIRAENAGSELQIFGGKFGWGESSITLTVYDGEGTSGQVLYQITNAGTTNYTLDSILATSTLGAMTITFTCAANYVHTGYELYIHCVGTALCQRPTQLTAQMTDAGEATASWAATATSYDFYYKPSGANTWTVQSTTANSITVTGLIPDTVYDMQVVAICGTDTSYPSFPIQLNTHFEVVIDPCDGVSDVTVDSITTTTAVIDWISDGNEWEIELKHLNVTDNFTVTSKPYTATNLLPTMNYSVRVRTLCSGTHVEPNSEWSAPVIFSTPSPNPPDPQGIDAVNGDVMSLFPNPASTTVTLTVGKQMVGSTLNIVDVNGRTVAKFEIKNPKFEFDVSPLTPGAYFVRITGEQNTVVRKLIVK